MFPDKSADVFDSQALEPVYDCDQGKSEAKGSQRKAKMAEKAEHTGSM